MQGTTLTYSSRPPETGRRVRTVFSHGNPYGERKICLDRDMLNADKFKDVTVVRSSEMIDTFISETKGASELAKKTDASLLVIFCYEIPAHDLLRDDGERNTGLSILALKAGLALRP